ncbi:hypothetical protein PHET_02125 [Paragonimus heterotremus]|uniref:Roc domain-containing protein n=1 Tax=Paragonimus heterotremus TaxID=100268 RepID=A0A8J4TGK4_9TREM|nr:hypothetical protein PHET_02125 [Paragonimus heterotremus]
MNISTDIIEDHASDKGSDPSDCNENKVTHRLMSNELLPTSSIPLSEIDHADDETIVHAESPGSIQASNSSGSNTSTVHVTGSPGKPSRLQSGHADNSSTSVTRSNTTTWISTSESQGTDSSTDDTESEQTSGDNTQDSGDELHSDAEEFNQAAAMQNADFSGQGLSTVPNAIFQRLSITRLNLSGNNLAFIPQELCSLIALRHLDISHNCLKGVQQSKTAYSPYLTSDLAPKPDQGFSRASSFIAPMPDELTQLAYLQTLIMSDCGLSKIPAVVFCLITLRKLNMSQNNISQLPIEFLNLQKCKINYIPENLSSLRCVESVDLSQNYFKKIPEGVYCIGATLKHLDMSNNPLDPEYAYLPSNFSNIFPNLTIFQLKKVNLLRIELGALAQLTQLKVLDISQNKLSSIPDDFAKLCNLSSLDMSRNCLANLPYSICKLRSLKVLDISHNQLQNLPTELYKLKRLRQVHAYKYLIKCGLWVVGNPLKEIRPHLWTTTSTRQLWAYLQSREVQNLTPIQPVRVIVLGSTSSGKSTLITRIVNSCTRMCRQTSIREIVKLSKQRENQPSISNDLLILDAPLIVSRCVTPNGVNLVIYELTTPTYSDGSQNSDSALSHFDFFQTMQSHLFDHESLYLLTFNVSDVVETLSGRKILGKAFDHKIGYWLKVISVYAPKSVVKLVGTHVDLVNNRSKTGRNKRNIKISSIIDLEQQVVANVVEPCVDKLSSWLCNPLDESFLASGTGSESDSEDHRKKLPVSLKDLFMSHLRLCSKKLETFANSFVRPEKTIPSLHILPEVSFLNFEKSDNSTLRRKSKKVANTYYSHLPETAMMDFINELEKRIVSPLFSHRRYDVSQSWSQFINHVKTEHKNKLFLKIDYNSKMQEKNDVYIEESDILDVHSFNFVSFNEIQRCLRHFHSSGDLFYFERHCNLRGFIILEPQRFFRIITGLTCPEYTLGLGNLQKLEMSTKLIRHLTSITGVSELEVVANLQELVDNQKLLHPMFRALLPLFELQSNKYPPKHKEVHSHPIHLKSATETQPNDRHCQTKGSNISGSSSSRLRGHRRGPYKPKQGPNHATHVSSPADQIVGNVVWLTELLQLGFQPRGYLTNGNGTLNRTVLYYLRSHRPLMSLQIRAQYSTKSTTGNSPSTILKEIIFPYIRPWGFYERICNELGRLLSKRIPFISFIDHKETQAPVIALQEAQHETILGEVVFSHELFKLSLHESIIHDDDKEDYHVVRFTVNFISDYLMLVDYEEQDSCYEQNDFECSNRNTPALEFNPILWFLSTCDQLTAEADGLAYYWGS